jgi:hypothetical protein
MMPGPPPFVLLPLDGGNYELRAFSDDSEDPIVLLLSDDDGRALRDALGRVLQELDAGREATEELDVDGRRVVLTGSASGIAIKVDR